MRGTRPVFVALAGVLFALAARDAWHVALRGDTTAPSIDATLAPLVAAAAGEGRIGFLAPSASAYDVLTRRVYAQYAFAPSVLSTGAAGTRLVVVWSARPEGVDRTARAEGLRVVARGADGYALLERP